MKNVLLPSGLCPLLMGKPDNLQAHSDHHSLKGLGFQDPRWYHCVSVCATRLHAELHGTIQRVFDAELLGVHLGAQNMSVLLEMQANSMTSVQLHQATHNTWPYCTSLNTKSGGSKAKMAQLFWAIFFPIGPLLLFLNY